MATALTAKQIATVKSTAPIIKEHGIAITSIFYKNLLTSHPELKNYFNLRSQQTGAQPKALAGAVFAYATHIDQVAKLQHAVERIAQKHASLMVKPEHYPIVGKYLVSAFAEVLGSALTPDIQEAWVAAYEQLAQLFIQREQTLYNEVLGWQDWRRFTITRKEAEAEDVMSFYLRPSQPFSLPLFLPGQYVSLQIPIPESSGLSQNRQFSISTAPVHGMEEYRITVKRRPTVEKTSLVDVERGNVPGLVTNLLHDKFNVGDEVRLSPPRGEFFFQENPAEVSTSAPVVLLSAGVGATPLVSIFDHLIASAASSRRPIIWAHGARQSNAACFRAHIRSTAERHENVNALFFVKDVRSGDKLGVEFDIPGRLDLATLESKAMLHLKDSATKYFICGPEDFMLEVREWLATRHVDPERIHNEVFRTGDL